MNRSDIGEADFPALLDLAERKYRAWCLEELVPDEARRISELKKQSLSSAGRAFYAIRISRELQERAVCKRIGFYAEVARDWQSSEMLTEPRLREYLKLILRTVRHSIAGLKCSIEQDARITGDAPESALPQKLRYVNLRSAILNVAKAELRVLEAEGKLASQRAAEKTTQQPPIIEKAFKDASMNETAPGQPASLQPNGKGRKRGPKPDLETASRMAEIVERVAPDGDWRPKCDDICLALDEAEVPIPKKWRRDRNCRCWSDCLERPIVVKVIEYRLELAKQREKAAPETFS
jgi:hypothetical protein